MISSPVRGGRQKTLLFLLFLLSGFFFFVPKAALAGDDENKLPDALEKSLTPYLTRVERLGLSRGIITDKAREGLAKRVSLPRILRAISTLTDLLEEGMRTLGRSYKWQGRKVPASLVRAWAEARQSGVPASAARTVTDASHLPGGWGGACKALDLLADLVVAGYPAKASALLVAGLIRQRIVFRPSFVKGALSSLVRQHGLSQSQAVKTLSKAVLVHRGNLSSAVRSLQRAHTKHAPARKSGKNLK